MGSILARKNYWLPSSRFDVDSWRRIRTLEGTTRRALRPRKFVVASRRRSRRRWRVPLAHNGNNRFSRADIKVECLRSADVLLGPCLFHNAPRGNVTIFPLLSFFFLFFRGSLVARCWRATNAVTFVSDRFKIPGKHRRKEIFLRRQQALRFYKYFSKINVQTIRFSTKAYFSLLISYASRIRKRLQINFTRFNDRTIT